MPRDEKRPLPRPKPILLAAIRTASTRAYCLQARVEVLKFCLGGHAQASAWSRMSASRESRTIMQAISSLIDASLTFECILCHDSEPDDRAQ